MHTVSTTFARGCLKVMFQKCFLKASFFDFRMRFSARVISVLSSIKKYINYSPLWIGRLAIDVLISIINEIWTNHAKKGQIRCVVAK